MKHIFREELTQPSSTPTCFLDSPSRNYQPNDRRSQTKMSWKSRAWRLESMIALGDSEAVCNSMAVLPSQQQDFVVSGLGCFSLAWKVRNKSIFDRFPPPNLMEFGSTVPYGVCFFFQPRSPNHPQQTFCKHCVWFGPLVKYYAGAFAI